MPTIDHNGNIRTKLYYATAHYSEGEMYEEIETDSLPIFILECEDHLSRGFTLIEMDHNGDQIGPLDLSDY